MDTQSSESRGGSETRLQRAIILELLSDDGGQQRTRTALASVLEVDADALDPALHALHGAGVIDTAEGRVWASEATRRLDALELIGV
jgi:hypothetical protein